MTKINAHDIQVTLTDNLPGRMVFGIRYVRNSTVTVQSEGTIQYNTATSEAIVSLWGEFPNVNFKVVQLIHYFVFSVDNYEGLKKLIAFVANQVQRDLDLITEAADEADREEGGEP